MIRVLLTCALLAPVALWSTSSRAATVIGCQDATQSDWPVSPQHPCPVASVFSGVVAITPGTPVAAGMALGYVLGTGCTATLTLLDGSTIALVLATSTGLQTLPFAVTNVSASACVGSFWNLN